MRRLLPAAVLLALLAASPAPAASALAPKFLLKAKALKEEVRLGESIPLELALHSASAKAVAVAPLELGSPAGLVFYVKTGTGATYQVSKLRGKYSGAEFKGDVLPLTQLKGGAKMEGKADLLAILPGKLEITAVFLGVNRAVQPEPLEAKPVTVTVLPGKDGETRVGARIRTVKGNMTVALEPTKAYNTVHNFLTLARDGYFTKRTFHRIMKDFMIQGGCPRGDGSGDPGWFLPAEFNDIRHEKGVISMARRGDHVNTAGCQFFVMHGTAKQLDGNYTAFGRLVEGTEVLDALANVPVQRSSDPTPSDPVIDPSLDGVDLVLLK
ncbi:MAG: peptidylprolyl isomerase [Polyangiaceae bacterium]|nr:peptidylprolyl isomerase [Polyangiaceae bacterium]